MKRADLERLKAEMSTRYAEQLEHEQTHLSVDQRAHMCMGFEHGMGWLWRLLETAGMKVEDDAEIAPLTPSELPPASFAEPRVCENCRVQSPAGEWIVQRQGPSACPQCGLAAGEVLS